MTTRNARRLGALATALLICLLPLAGCQSGVAANCSKAQECGQLGNNTEEQCKANGSNCYDKLRASSVAICNTIADKEDAWLHCTAGLSCADRGNLLTVNAACKAQFDELTKAVADSKLSCPCYF